MATMHCPSCGEAVELADTGVTFKHVFRTSGVSSMFHDDRLVHECNVDLAQVFQAQRDDVVSERWSIRL